MGCLSSRTRALVMRRGPQRWPAVTPGFRACGLFRSGRDQLPSSFHGNLGLVSSIPHLSGVGFCRVGFPVDRPLELGHAFRRVEGGRVG